MPSEPKGAITNRLRRLPVVLGREEVRRVFASLDGVPLVVCSLL